MVQEGRRNATSNVRAVGEAAVWKISFVCRTRGDCALAGARLHCTGGSASDPTGCVNDLPGVAPQRRHPQWRFGVSRVDNALARRAISPPTKTGKIFPERGFAVLCSGSAGGVG